MQRFIKWLAVITSLDLLIVLLGGALVTKTGSGQGCGKSWPLCNGEFVPSNLSMETIIELSHRLTSGSQEFLSLSFVFCPGNIINMCAKQNVSNFILRIFSCTSINGAAAVVWGQMPAVLAIHFGISLISFASVILLTCLIFEIDQKFDARSLIMDKKMKFHIYGVTIYCYLVVYTGALVRHERASLACPDFLYVAK